jgi:hypothetical protein
VLKYNEGDKVVHPEFGEGFITRNFGNLLTVFFKDRPPSTRENTYVFREIDNPLSLVQ